MRNLPINNDIVITAGNFRNSRTGVRTRFRNQLTPMFWLVLIGIVVRLTVNPAIVSYIYPYTRPGGIFLSHIHPGSYMLLLAGTLSFFPVLSRTPKRANLLLWATIGVMLACVIGVLLNISRGNGNLVFVVDSLFVAPLSLFAIANLTVRQQSIVGYVLIAIILVNGVVSIVEVFLHKQLLPEVYTDVNFFSIDNRLVFRPQGLFGHPLATGGIAVPAMPLVFIFIRDFFWKWSFVIFMAASAAIAQDRGATVVAALVLVILAVMSINNDIKSGVVSARTVVVSVTLSVLTIPAIVWMLYSTGRLERLLVSNSDDKSAAARVVIYDFFKLMTPSEFYWGMDMVRATWLSTNILHIAYFESSVVVFIITFGLLYTIIFLPLIYLFVISISLGSSWHVKVSIIVFLILASSNNALSTPGPDLIAITALAFIAAVRYRRGGEVSS